MALTIRDLARLVRATGLPADELVTWLTPDEVDMSGELDSFVELREGPRLMVLAQREGACVLLGQDDRCGAYAARPRDCRAYPFHIEVTSSGARRLALLPLQGCDYAEDGLNEGGRLAEEDEARGQELRAHQHWVRSWNRSVWHRRRLHKRVASAPEFLQLSLARLESLAASD